MDTNFNPYYEERLKKMNFLLERIQTENAELEKENKELEESLNSLEKVIQSNYDQVNKSIMELKSI